MWASLVLCPAGALLRTSHVGHPGFAGSRYVAMHDGSTPEQTVARWCVDNNRGSAKVVVSQAQSLAEAMRDFWFVVGDMGAGEADDQRAVAYPRHGAGSENGPNLRYVTGDFSHWACAPNVYVDACI